MKKKTRITILLLLLVFLLGGCGSNPTTTESDSTIPMETGSQDESTFEKTDNEDTEEVNLPPAENQEMESTENTIESDITEEEEKKAQEELDKQEAEEKALLTKTNSISMLNYLTVIAEEVHQSSNSRLFLEEASFSLLNNLYPNAVDKTTQTHISNMVRNIDELRILTQFRSWRSCSVCPMIRFTL